MHYSSSGFTIKFISDHDSGFLELIFFFLQLFSGFFFRMDQPKFKSKFKLELFGSNCFGAEADFFWLNNFVLELELEI